MVLAEIKPMKLKNQIKIQQTIFSVSRGGVRYGNINTHIIQPLKHSSNILYDSTPSFLRVKRFSHPSVSGAYELKFLSIFTIFIIIKTCHNTLILKV